MTTVNIHEAKTHLSRLLEAVEKGEELIIARAGKPIAVLSRYEPPPRKRKLGTLAGQIVEHPGCWDPDSELEKAMEESQLFPDEP